MDRKDDDINEILKKWPFDPQSVNVRMLESAQHRVLQMRVDMGILQLETEGRPDGNQFQGAKTYFEYLQNKSAQTNHDFLLDEDSCLEVDREFVQFYHRRVCWLQLKEFELAVRDADHTLGLMDFCKQHSDDEQWTISHEQYRPFVLYHRTQAAALSHIEGKDEETPTGADLAIEEVNQGLEKLRDLFVEYDAEEQFDEDELVQRLTEFREGLREKYEVGATVKEQLEAAITNEDYELAAQLRDELSNRDSK
ncbi:MAG: UvrB/UvrC motif-containing protein [Mariniblastus sp.]